MEKFGNYIWLLVGTLVADWGIASFLLPNHFIDGGVTGISMLLAKMTGMHLALWIAIANLPFIYLGYKHLSKAFAVKTGIAIAAVSIWLLIIPFPVFTTDKLLGAIFGGIFVGAGVGLAIRGGAVTDGTEIMAVILSKKMAATVGELILGLNVVIFIFAGFFVGVEPALYSVLTYFAAFKTIDFILHGIEAYNGVMILSPRNEEIRAKVLQQLGRGVTILKGVGGYTATEQPVLYCVVTRLELPQLQNIARSIDENAFVVVSPVHEVSGGVIKQRHFH